MESLNKNSKSDDFAFDMNFDYDGESKEQDACEDSLEILNLKKFIVEMEMDLQNMGVSDVHDELTVIEETIKDNSETPRKVSDASARTHPKILIKENRYIIMDEKIEREEHQMEANESTYLDELDEQSAAASMLTSGIETISELKNSNPCVKSYLELQEYLTSPQVEKDASEAMEYFQYQSMHDGASRTHPGHSREHSSSSIESSESVEFGTSTETGEVTTPSGVHHTPHLCSLGLLDASPVSQSQSSIAIKNGVDAFFNSLRVTNLDLHHSTPNIHNSKSKSDVLSPARASSAMYCSPSPKPQARTNQILFENMETPSPADNKTTSTTGMEKNSSKVSPLSVIHKHFDRESRYNREKVKSVSKGPVKRSKVKKLSDNDDIETQEPQDDAQEDAQEESESLEVHNADTIYGNVTPETVKLLSDSRIAHDYEDWCSGPKMKIDGINEAYSGLYGTMLSTGNYILVHGIEVIMRPDIPLMTHILPAIERLAEATKLTCDVQQSSHYFLEQNTALLQNPDAVSAEKVGLKSRGGGSKTAATDDSTTPNKAISGVVGMITSSPVFHKQQNNEWDCIDIQVCMSRALKHRVLLCQFLKKLSPFVSTPQISDAKTPPKHGRHSENMKSKPYTEQFYNILKRVLTLSGLSLSCLYVLQPSPKSKPKSKSVSVEEEHALENNHRNMKDVSMVLSLSLDFHYMTQLEGLYREAMWKELRESGKLCDENYKISEQDCANVLSALQPIYREHDVALPDPPAKAKLSEFAASVSDKSKLFPIHSPEIEKYVNPHAVANMEATPETLASSSATITEQDSGMAIIIKLLSDAWEMQKKKSEVEIRNRLRQKNERLADAALKFTAYKNILFRTLVESKKAQNSRLNIIFVSAFKDVPDTDWDAPVDSTTTRDRISATTSTSLSAIGNWWSGKSSASGNSTNADTATKTHMSLTCPPVVLFYCACLISTTPGTVYVTCDRVYIQYGVGFLTPTKIVFPLSTISNCASDPTASLPTLLIHIVNRSKTISVTPLAVECSVLKDVIYSLLLHYHNES